MRALTPDAAAAAATADMRQVVEALSAASGNVTRAAEALGINRRTLDRRITDLGLRTWLATAYPRSVRQPKR